MNVGQPEFILAGKRIRLLTMVVTDAFRRIRARNLTRQKLTQFYGFCRISAFFVCANKSLNNFFSCFYFTFIEL